MVSEPPSTLRAPCPEQEDSLPGDSQIWVQMPTPPPSGAILDDSHPLESSATRPKSHAGHICHVKVSSSHTKKSENNQVN